MKVGTVVRGDPGMKCECIYNNETHPNCQRDKPTTLVELSNTNTAYMCDWCSNDWFMRNGLNILFVVFEKD